jgi:hypothetical protein
METFTEQQPGLPEIDYVSLGDSLADRVLQKEIELLNHGIIAKICRERHDRAGGWDKDAKLDYTDARVRLDGILGDWVELQTQL